MNGLGYDYSGGIFGGGGMGAEDATGAGTTSAPAEQKWPTGNDFLGQKLGPGPLDPQVDAAVFVTGPDAIARMRPEVLKPYTELFDGYSVGGISAENMPPGITGVGAGVIVPTSKVVGNPYFKTLKETVELTDALGGYLFVPKQIIVPQYGDRPLTLLAFSGSGPAALKFGQDRNTYMYAYKRYVAPAIVPVPNVKAGMGVGKMALIGVGVFAAGYVATRVAQKKPIFPKGK